MSLPNNQSLTRLVLPLSLSLSPLSECLDVTARTANNTDRPLLAKLWLRINLVKLPTRLARSRSLPLVD